MNWTHGQHERVAKSCATFSSRATPLHARALSHSKRTALLGQPEGPQSVPEDEPLQKEDKVFFLDESVSLQVPTAAQRPQQPEHQQFALEGLPPYHEYTKQGKAETHNPARQWQQHEWTGGQLRTVQWSHSTQQVFHSPFAWRLGNCQRAVFFPDIAYSMIAI